MSGTWYFDNISIVELIGNHAVMADTAAKQPEILWDTSANYPYVDFSSSPLRHLVITHDSSLSPANGTIYANVSFDAGGSGNRIAVKTTSDFCLGWVLLKQTDDTIRFRQITSGCINNDVNSTNDAYIDGSYNNIIAVGATNQAVNLNGDYNSIVHANLQATAENLYIGTGINDISLQPR